MQYKSEAITKIKAMRRITLEAAGAFIGKYNFKKSNTQVIACQDSAKMYLFGNLIAVKTAGKVQITNAGWSSPTTKERLNGIPGVRIQQVNHAWLLNGAQWDGSWITI